MSDIREMLIRHEGYKKQVYFCPANHRTIGVGWNIDANPLPRDIAAFLHLHGFITDEMVDRLLDLSIEAATNNCRDIYKDFDQFSENRRNALIDFMFNIGAGTALKFKVTNKAIKDKRWWDAANGIRNSAYYKQVGARGEEIAHLIEMG